MGGLSLDTGLSLDSSGAALSVYAAGTAASLTNTQALLDFGTTDPSLVLNQPGVWMIFGTAQLKYNAATFVSNQTVTMKLRRTNNTAADVTAATRTVDLGIVTTFTNSAGVAVIPPVVYTTLNSNDILQLFGAVSVAPSAGSLDVVSAEIVAVKIG